MLERVQSDIDRCGSEDALSLSQKTRACNDILKTLASLFAKLSGPDPSATSATNPFHFLQRNGSQSKLGYNLLRQSIQITFSDPKIYFRDCQFMAGIVTGWVLEIVFGADRSWLGFVLLDTPSVTKDDEMGGSQVLSLLKDTVLSSSSNVDGFYSLLCFYRGILTTVGPISTTIQLDNSGTSLLSEVYQRIMNIIDKASDSATRVLAFQTLATWMKVLKDSFAKGYPAPTGIDTIQIFKASFELVFTFWEDPVDTTQHKLKDVFIAMLEILRFFQQQQQQQSHPHGSVFNSNAASSFLLEIVDKLLKADWLRKVKYDLLAHLLAVIHPDEILKLRPDFLTVCFDVMSNLSMSSRICAFLIRFFSTLFDKNVTPTLTSCLLWINPFCYALSHPSANLRRAFSENLLGFVFKDKKPYFDVLLTSFQTNVSSSTGHTNNNKHVNMDYYIHGSISLLKTGRTLGFLQSDFLSSSNGENNRRIIRAGISHPDGIIRNDVCGILCDSARALAEPGVDELEFVKVFLTVNTADYKSEFRQKLFGNVHKLICRIRKCLYANQRDLKTRESFLAKKTGSDEAIQTAVKEIEELTKKVDVKMGFLNWLMEFAVISLSPGSSFPRTTSALVLLSTIRDAEEMSLDSTFNKSLSAEFCTFNNAACAAALASILLNDTYEPSRQSAFNLLMSMKGDIPGFGQTQVQELVNQGLKMLFSVKASDADGGAFVFRLIFSKYVLQGGRYFQVSKDFQEKNSMTVAPAAFFLQLLSVLENYTTINEVNLSDTITEYPMHGLFAALRSVLGEINYSSFKTASEISLWNNLLRQTSNVVLRATKCVLAVLSNESPEGNYPGLNEEAAAADEVNAEAILADAGGEKTSKSQRILHECFRTVKEACGVLEVVLCRPPLPDTAAAATGIASPTTGREILDYDMIVSGGDWLRMLLTSIRHYGAFSGVFTCFSALCATLLCSQKQLLVTLPQIWLSDFLHKAEVMDVSITRRSGGLPLGVVAVLGSASPYRAALVEQTMTRLFKMANAEVPVDANTNLDLPQVHAFNIIRRLLQDATVTTLMRDYFADCFVLSIDGLSSKSFPIRNCATMLFSSLVTKVIGVKKSRDQDHSINTVSGREFFARFPSLHAFMTAKLAVAVSKFDGEDHAVHPAFYPILTILARLKPTDFDGNNSHLTLSAFKPLVEKCASSSFIKVREITARAYAALIPAAEFSQTVKQIMAGLTSSLEYNDTHGRLLIVRNLIQMHLFREKPTNDVIAEFSSQIPDILSSSFWVISGCQIPTIQDVYVQILSDLFVVGREILRPLPTSLLENAWTESILLFTKTNTQETKRNHGWTYNLRQTLASFILDCLSLISPRTSVTDIILFLLKDPDYEVQLQALRYLQTRSSASTGGGDGVLMLDWSQIVPKLVSLVHSKASYEQVCYTAAHVCRLPHVQEFLQQSVLDRVSLETVVVVSIAEDFAERLSMTENTYEVEAILPLLALIVMNGQKGGAHVKTNDDVNVLIGLMKKWSSEETAVYVRVSVANTLGLILPKFTVDSEESENIYAEMLLHLDILLDDDDSDVRAVAAEIVSEHLNSKEPMIPIQCRAALFSHAIHSIKSSRGIYKIAYYAQTLLIGAVDAETLLEGQINPTHALFSKEESNQNKEESVDAIMALRVLHKIFEHSSNLDIKRRIQSRLYQWVSTSVPALELRQEDLGGLKGRGKVFGFALRLVVAMVLLSHPADTERMQVDGDEHFDVVLWRDKLGSLALHDHIMMMVGKEQVAVTDAIMDLFPRLLLEA
ncbi:putative death-receptor fusion protein-domain-containing protein [Obelidium mucronatum]|nr:putative death-receptor fusion protein-domain-containing protein [Obelidium mucronatum]